MGLLALAGFFAPVAVEAVACIAIAHIARWLAKSRLALQAAMRVTARSHATLGQAGVEYPHAMPDPKAPHRPVTQRRAAGAARMGTIRAAKTFVGRHVALVKPDGQQGKDAHDFPKVNLV